MTDQDRDKQAQTDASLDAFFEAARKMPELSLADETAFMARVLADAQAAQAAAVRDVVQAVKPPWWQRLAEPLGGLGAVSGLVAAAATGVMIGISPPDVLASGFEAAALWPQAAQDIDLESEMGLLALFEEN